MFWRITLGGMGLGVALLAVYVAVVRVPPPAALPTPAIAGGGSAPTLTPTAGVPWFVNVTNSASIGFVHFNSATPRHYIQEVMGSGIAWIDYDNDGWPDLFCVQVGPLEPKSGAAAPTNKMYRNNRGGTFSDATDAVGLARAGYGMGAAVGDIDNDGYDDLLVTYLGGVVLYHNETDGRGGRRFVDVTQRAGLTDPHWATSAAFGDIDGDGLLDLYICNYCEVDLSNYPVCRDQRTLEYMCCPPSHFPSAPHRLYRNEGKLRFSDVTRSSGVEAASASPGLGVVMADLDGDGRLDIYVANDMKPAFLFHNQGGGKFVEKALLSGCALGPEGNLVAGMGIALGDFDGSGRPSLFVTNFDRKPNVLYVNRGNLWFQDLSMPSGLGGPSITRLAFGAEFLDADLDGRLDVAIANGHIQRLAEKVAGTTYAQQAQLFTGDGRGKFKDVSDAAGAYFRAFYVGRGLAVADYDNDGKPDLAISHNGDRVALLHNETPTEHHWLRLELVGDGAKSNRNAVGAKVEIEAGGTRQTRYVIGGGSYLSAGDRRLLIGLAAASKAERVAVTWPSGRRQVFADLSGRKGYRLIEGKETAEVMSYD